MKLLHLVFCTFLCLLSFSACLRDNGTTFFGDGKTTLLSVVESSTLADSLLFEEPKVVFLEANEASFQQRLDRIFIDENKLITFDRSQSKVVMYDLEGNYISSLHNIGKGPMEYRAVLDVGVDTDSNQIFLLCDVPYKIMVFDYNMQYMHEYKLPKLYRSFIVSKDYFYCRQAETINYEPNDYYVDLLSREDGSLVESVLPISPDINDFNTFNIGGNKLTQTGSILLSTMENTSIYELKGKTIHKKYELTQSGKDTVQQVTNIFESADFLIMDSDKGLLVSDKTSDTLYRYKYGLYNLDPIHGSAGKFLPISGDEHRLVFLQNPAKLKMIAASFRQAVSDGKVTADQMKNDKFIKFTSQVKETDNPILIIYEFKNK